MAENPSGIPESGEGKVNDWQKILLEIPESGEGKVNAFLEEKVKVR